MANFFQLGNTLTPGTTGLSVATNADSTIVAVGVPHIVGSNNYGQIKVFKFNNGNWDQLGSTINMPLPLINNSGFGNSISLNGDGTILAAGAPGAGSRGEAYVFALSAGDWALRSTHVPSFTGPQGPSQPPTATYPDLTLSKYSYGTTVGLNLTGNVLAVGSPNEHYWDYNFNLYSTGVIEVIDLSGANISGNLGDYSMNQVGSVMTMNLTGNIIAFKDGVSNSLRVCTYNPSSPYGQWDYTEINGPSAEKGFGSSLTLNGSGNRLAVGSSSLTNKTYFYSLSTSSWVSTISSINPAGGGTKRFDTLGKNLILNPRELDLVPDYLYNISLQGGISNFVPNFPYKDIITDKQSTGKIIVAGSFTTVNGLNTRIFRLNTDGSIDNTFTPPIITGSIFTIKVQKNFGQVDKILVGGTFSVGGNAQLCRLNSNGSLDTSFVFLQYTNSIGIPAKVLAIEELPSGSLLIGGEFVRVSGNTRSRLARVTSGGLFDPTFPNIGFSQSGTTSSVTVIKYLSSVFGKVLIGGYGFITMLTTSNTIDTTFQNYANSQLIVPSSFAKVTSIEQYAHSGFLLSMIGTSTPLKVLYPAGTTLLVLNGGVLNGVIDSSVIQDLDPYSVKGAILAPEGYTYEKVYVGGYHRTLGTPYLLEFTVNKPGTSITGAKSYSVPDIVFGIEEGANNRIFAGGGISPNNSYFIRIGNPTAKRLSVVQANNDSTTTFSDEFFLSNNFLPSNYIASETAISTAGDIFAAADNYGNNVYINSDLFSSQNINISSNFIVKPVFSTISTTTGYSPLLSLYPNNTGTAFELIPTIYFGDIQYPYTLFLYNTSIGLSFLTPVSALSIYNTLTSFPPTYTGKSVYHSIEDILNTKREFPLSVQGNLAFPGLSSVFTTTTTGSFVLVDPPFISASLDSIELSYFNDNTNTIVNDDVTLTIAVTNTLPCATFTTIAKGNTTSSNSHWQFINESNTITPFISTFSFTTNLLPGQSETVAICAFPLLSATTDINYITGSNRLLETGIHPIVIEKQYTLFIYDRFIPAENIALDYKALGTNTDYFSFNNISNTDVLQVTGFNFLNQFNQSITPVIALSSYIKSTEDLSVTELTQSLNSKTLMFSISTPYEITQGEYDLTQPTSSIFLTLQDITKIKEILITVKPKGTINVTTKVFPVSSFAFNYITPTIYFNKFLPAWYASILNPVPFEVIVWNNTLTNINSIQLYAKDSKSSPYSSELTRYNRLVPTWYFQDINGNKVEILNSSPVSLYNSYNSTYIGSSASYTFYFKDDKPTGPDGELLIATPIVSGSYADSNTPSYANSKQRATLKYYVNNITPSTLYITRDGNRDLKPYYWLSAPVPNTIAIGSIQKIGNQSSIDFTYPYSDDAVPFSIGIKKETSEYLISSSSTTHDQFTVTYFNTAFQAIDKNGNSTTGFVRTSLTPLSTGNNVKIIASTTVSTTGQYMHTPFAWIGDNKNSQVCNIYVDPTYSSTPLIQNEISQSYITCNIPSVTSDIVNNTEISNISYIEMDGEYNTWMLDNISRKLYKINPIGNIITSVQILSSYIPQNISIDNNQDIWVCTISGSNILKYTTNGQYVTSIPLLSAERPLSIETTLSDHLLVGISTPTQSYIKEFDENNNLIKTISLSGFYNPIELYLDYRQNDPRLDIVTTNYISGGNYNIGSICTYDFANNACYPVLTGFYSPKFTNLNNNHEILLSIGNNNILIYNPVLQSLRENIAKVINLTPIFNNFTNIVQNTYTQRYIPNFNNPSVFNNISGSAFNTFTSNKTNNIITVGTNSGLFVTQDQGLTWTNPISDSSSFTWNDIIMTETGEIQLATTPGKLYISTNFGNAWEYKSPDKFYRKIACNKDGSVIYACVYKETTTSSYLDLELSTDFGNTWTVQSTIPYTSPVVTDVFDMQTDADGKIILVGSSTINSKLYISKNFGQTWSQTGETNYFNQVIISKNGEYISTIPSFSSPTTGIYFSTNTGNSWYFSPTVQKIKFIEINDTGELLTGIDYNSNIIQSVNYGSNFTSTSTIYDYNKLKADADFLEFLAITDSSFIKINKKQDIIDFTNINSDIITNDQDVITGVGGHSDGTVWVLNSAQSKIYVLSFTEDSCFVIKTINVKPELQNITAFTNIANQLNIKPIVAQGDWTGIHRGLKYGTRFTRSLSISGESIPFQVKNKPDEFRTVNDSYNLAETLSKIFPETLNKENYPVFHNEFLKGAVGSSKDDYQTISRQFYEKISNFVKNHNDIDYCNIPQLYNIAKSFGVELDEYNLSYPSDISRVLNLASISLKRLTGTPNNFDKNLSYDSVAAPNETIYSAMDLVNYADVPLSPETQVQAGEKIVVYDIFKNKHDLLYIHTTSLVKNLTSYGLRTPLYFENSNTFNQYIFYPYKQANIIKLTNSYIDWENEYTTISQSQSSMQEWYKDGGIIDQLFNYYLNKGLGFITDTTNK